jgi:uncharacterized cupredoxin-like copper-binding protein
VSVSRRRRRLAPAAALVPFALLLAACGGGAAATVAPAPSGAIAVDASEYKFTPSAITSPTGDVTFWVRNAGSVEHQFLIFKGDEIVDRIDTIPPGQSRGLPVTLLPGDYTFVCQLSGHDQLGMKGTFTVQGG